MIQRPQLKVFLTYAHEDIITIRALYNHLKSKGFDVWFDKEKLIAGQNWREEIEKALNSSDAIIVCLSHDSVTKEGFVQREFKFAFDKALEIPEGNIFLIPVRLKECKVPDSLKTIQYVDLFAENGLNEIERALNARVLQIEKQIARKEEVSQVNVSASSIPSTTAPISQRIMSIIFNPSVWGQDRSEKLPLSGKYKWFDADDLTTKFILELNEISYGHLRPRIEQRFFVHEYPVKIDGFRYTNEEYLDVLQGRIRPHMPQEIDYQNIINRFSIMERINDDEIDEVWLFGPPHSGFYASTMGGPRAFWCNGPAIVNTNSFRKKFIVMGFTYDRDVGDMLHSYGNRAESIMHRVYENFPREENVFRKFTLYDRVAPGQAGCGTTHFAPNSTQDYDWGNKRKVISSCDDWFNYPNMKGLTREVNCEEWGNGDILLHHKWWFRHLPHGSGKPTGIANNWWYYIADPNNVAL